ncbi:MAG TPA: SpoIIE family protein phosphatase [Bacteroidia bacterium]|nr:SpoIIE family protein phosphatase [Bacteroidia bacterium]
MRRFFFFLLFLSSCTAFAQSEADSLVRLLPGISSDTARVNMLNRIAKIYDDISDSTEFIYSRQALALAQKTGYTAGEARAHVLIGLGMQGRSNFTQAIQEEQLADTLYAQLGDTLGRAKALGNMANNEYYIGDYTSAADHSLRSLRFYEALGNHTGIFANRLTLGNVSFDQNDFSEALKQYKLALAECRYFQDTPNMAARALVSIGNVHNSLNEPDSAAANYITADSIFEKIHAGYETSVCLNNLATIRQSQHRYAETRQLLIRCLALRRATPDSESVCSVYQNIGSLSRDLGKPDSALLCYYYSLKLAHFTGSRSQMLNCYEGLASTYADLRRFDSAYYFLHRYKELNDSVAGEESVNAVNQLKQRYASEKQQHHIDLIESQRAADKANSERNIALLVIGIFVLLTLVTITLYRYRAKQKTNEALERQNMEITMQKKAITDSINYAKKIQDSILPPLHVVKEILPDSFILYEPKDVVSGDFFWVEKRDGFAIFSAVDCTGHGVPGALMSVVGFNLLTQAVNEIGLTKPADILGHLDYGVNKLLRQSEEENTVKDGMDLALCSYHAEKRLLQYAGVFNPAYVVSAGELIVLKADKFPIGINVDGVTDTYTHHEMTLKPGDMIYVFSDGYADQFGGPLGKKFKYNQFRDLLLSIWQEPVDIQEKMLRDAFHRWRGNHEQVDDILVIGVRVK